ncbi:hypothetical protein Tco_1441117 [Tanacetum coccineum]
MHTVANGSGNMVFEVWKWWWISGGEWWRVAVAWRDKGVCKILVSLVVLGAFPAFGPKTKVVENSFPVAWALESRQSEFVCSSYGQNSGQVSGGYSWRVRALAIGVKNVNSDVLVSSETKALKLDLYI